MLPSLRPFPLGLRRRGRELALATAVLLPAGGALAIADTPATTARSFDGAATAARITWAPPASITEEQRFSLGLSGQIDGQATAHIALLDAATACPASPLYPRQIAAGTKLTLTPDPAAPTPTPSPSPAPTTTTPLDTTPTTPADTTPATTAPIATTPAGPTPLGALVGQSLTLTEKDSGTYHLCGWVVASPAVNEASTLARFDSVVQVANRPSTVTAEIPEAARSGDYFSVKVTGTTPAAGRRLLVMAEPNKGQTCSNLRKAAAGKRPLQTVVGIGSGDYAKTLKLRYRTKTAGAYLLCIQVVESSDRIPEAATSAVQTVTESLKCVNTQTAITQRKRDLEVIRGRRDAAQKRLSAARKKLTPLRSKYSAAKKQSTKRIATASKAVRKAKSAAGKKKARKHLAAVRRSEAKRLSRVGAPYRKANAAIKVQERTYKQYRTGASLLTDTITRMKKDSKKYCAKAVS